MSSNLTRTLVAVAALVAVVAPQVVHARDVKRCGITIGTGQTGTLVQDVECGYRCYSDATVRCELGRDDFECPLDREGCVAETITIEKNAKLDLNGFDLRGAYNKTAIECSTAKQGRCTVQGPGTLFASKGRAIRGNDQDIVLKDLVVYGPYDSSETTGWLRATNVELQACDASFVGGKGIRVKNLILGTNCYLDSRKNLYIDGMVTSSHANADGTVRAKNVISTNGGIGGKDVFLRGVHMPEPLDESSTHIDVGAQRRLVLRDSVIGGVLSGQKPTLIDSSCLISRKVGTAQTWGVCATD